MDQIRRLCTPVKFAFAFDAIHSLPPARTHKFKYSAVLCAGCFLFHSIKWFMNAPPEKKEEETCSCTDWKRGTTNFLWLDGDGDAFAIGESKERFRMPIWMELLVENCINIFFCCCYNRIYTGNGDKCVNEEVWARVWAGMFKHLQKKDPNAIFRTSSRQ